ncbi:MAG: hypothetical protein PHO37_11365 [Kiritimatiellae bacterium]|nr:hypothetical protein [Kiritimatiellia bacterium]
MWRKLLLATISVALTFLVLQAQEGRTPFTTNPLRPFELKNDVLIPGYKILKLKGSAEVRIWAIQEPTTEDIPLLTTGQTVTNGINCVDFGTYPSYILYVECLTAGTATLEYSYVGTGQAEGYKCQTEMKMTVVMLNFIDLSSSKLGESPHPPPFAGQKEHVFYPDKSPQPDQHAVVLYKDVVDGNFNIEDFDITFFLDIAPQSIADHLTYVWEKVSGPDSGELISFSIRTAVYRNPKEGGVYRFRVHALNNGIPVSYGEVNLVLPLAGAEMGSVLQVNIPMADSFVARVKTKYIKRDYMKRKQLDNWFVTWKSGDYVGRPDNQNTPSVWYYGQISDAYDDTGGLGAICTWKGRPVRMSKMTNFLVAYTVQKLGVNYLRAKIGLAGSAFGTGDGLTASKSWDDGWNFAKNGGNYDATASNLVNYIWTHEVDEDKSRKPWPNPSTPDNNGGSPLFHEFDHNRHYAVPGFLFQEQ